MFPRVFYGAHHNSDPPHRYPRIIYVCSTNTVASETCVDRTALGPLSRTEIFRRCLKLAFKHTYTPYTQRIYIVIDMRVRLSCACTCTHIIIILLFSLLLLLLLLLLLYVYAYEYIHMYTIIAFAA